MPNRVLEISGLALFDPLGKQLLGGVEFSAVKGEALHIIGENGLGKTALLNSVFGDYRKFKGKVKLHQKEFSYLPQLSAKRPKLPVNLEAVCDKEFSFYPQKVMMRPLNGASGGERKRAMLARVFNQNAPLIVLDEPLNHLDKQACGQVGEWLQGYLDNGGTLIYTGHSGNLPVTKEVDLTQWKC